MGTLAFSMASAESLSLKRTYDEAGLDDTVQHHQASPISVDAQSFLQPVTDASGQLSVSPTVAEHKQPSFSPPKDKSVMAGSPPLQSTPNTLPAPTTARRSKQTAAEKEAKRLEKEAKDRHRAEEKSKKDEEKRLKDAEKEEKRKFKEEQFRLKEEERKFREDERKRKDEEKRLKDEEKEKKAKASAICASDQMNASCLHQSSPNFVSTLSSYNHPCPVVDQQDLPTENRRALRVADAAP